MAKDNYTELGIRIEELFKILNGKGIEMNNGIMANALDMDASQLSGVKTGKYSFTYKQLMELNAIYGVRASWLLEGELPVLKEKSGNQQPPDSDLLTLIKNAKANLEKAEKAATEILHLQTNKRRPVQRAALGNKSVNDINPQRQNEPRDNVSKKGN